jgi:AmmeMemoRadiSam system protein A
VEIVQGELGGHDPDGAYARIIAERASPDLIGERRRAHDSAVDAIVDPTGRAALTLARDAVEGYVRHGVVADPPSGLPPELGQPSGVFVTLRTGGRLRGCVGTLATTRVDIAHEIVASAIAAATADPRFPSVGPAELGALDYEVDIVEPIEAAKDLTDLDPQVYGVVVEGEEQGGVLLPALAGVETAAQQVDIARSKAGLAAAATIQLYRFRVRRFREPC